MLVELFLHDKATGRDETKNRVKWNAIFILIDVEGDGMLRQPADFAGQCLVGECVFDASLLLPSSSYLGLPKAVSYLYGTWRDGG